MSEGLIELLTNSGDKISLDGGDLDVLKESVRGEVILPSHEQYDESRKIWNAMIDRKPGIIVECTGHADVVACVKFARSHILKVCVRGGGHNIAGKSLADKHLLIDLSKWRAVFVDAKKQIANISPGATLGDIDHETKEYGLLLSMGINSTTGISGLALGGGFGWISRKFGMTCDNLIGATVVKADGTTVRADKTTNSDLFWALQGGGGNFGIVTNFEFQLHEVGPMVTAGPMVFQLEDAPKILSGLEQYKDNRDLTTWGVFRQAPPFPFLPEEVHFKPVFVLAVCFIGKDDDEALSIMDTIKGMGTLVGDHVAPTPFSKWQQAFDPLLTPGLRNYWRTLNFDSIETGMAESLVEMAKTLPNFGSEIFLAQLGGYTNTVKADATAYAHRSSKWLINCHMRWEDAQADEENMAWSKNLFNTLIPYSDGTTYQNFVSEADEKTEAVYGSNMHKLAEIKQKYDPDNFFSVNYNVRPTA